MRKFRQGRHSVQKKKYLKRNTRPADPDDFPELDRVQKRIIRQAALAGLTVVLTVVILFAVTSAWYTNIVQTSGLTFQAEAWGFEGTITVDNDAILASPGEEGIIHLEVQNESDSISAVSLNISKANMTDDMKKRLYFYVDTRMSRNGEIMDRVYVNNYENYTYTIFGQNSLFLTEERSNGPQLKWEWVYDVLGYYVMAKPVTYTVTAAEDGSTEGSTEPITRMDIRDYLRPIEYDYENATFGEVEKEDGSTVKVLKTVDGNDVDLFLQKLTQNDGYTGSYDPEAVADGYYPVDVDESGYGVYIYLCTPTEVEQANDIDSELGRMAYKLETTGYITEDEQKQINAEAVLTLSAQKNESMAVSVNTHTGLQAAIAAGTADVIQLGGDISIPKNEPLVIPADTSVMLDLNGNTVTSQTGTAIYAMAGSSLTMLNGVMQCEEQHADSREIGVFSTGAEVVMSNVKMSGYEHGVYVGDNDTNAGELDSRVHLLNCEIDATVCAAFVSGNGSLSEQKSQLIVEKCELSSDSIVISGNGDTTGNGRWGTDIQIIDSTVTGNTATASGIYQPQKNSTLTVYNSTVTGCVGIALKGGTAKIIGSTVCGTGVKQEPATANSGFTDTGDAVYIDTGYGYDILLEVSDILASDTHSGRVSVLTSTNSYSLQVYEQDAPNVAVKISGGEFDEQQPDDYLVDNAEQSATSNQTYIVKLKVEEETETEE